MLGLSLGHARSDKGIDEESLRLIEEREMERARRNFKRADEIRELLRERGITLEDTPSGTKWSHAER